MSLFANVCRELAFEADKELHHFRLKGMHALGFLTYRCTSRCRTCNIWKRPVDEARDEIGLEQWMVILEKMKHYGIRSFEIFGGDALLRKDVIFDLIRYCSANGIETFFPTNANLCDRETIRELIRSGLGTVYFSIDDVGDEHDGVRGVDGTFVRVTQALEDFLDERGGRNSPKIVVCTTLSNLNYRNFPRVVDFLKRYPVNAIYPRPLGEFSRQNVELSIIDGLVPEPYFAPSDGASHRLNREQLAELKMIIQEMKRRKDNPYINFRSVLATPDSAFLSGRYPHRDCRVASTLVTIAPNGDVVPCPFFGPFVVGNLVREEFEEIWGNARHRMFVERQRQDGVPLCRNCNMRIDTPSMLETLHYYCQRGLELCGIAG